MKKLPNIFKPNINHSVDNNKEVYYSSFEENVRNSKNGFNNYDTREVIIKTRNKEFKTIINGRIGNNILTTDGKIISISDIISIDKT